MEWTKEKPKEDGWYWYKDEDFGPSVICVGWQSMDSLIITYPEYADYLPDFGDANGEWYGPIEEPED